MASAPHHFDEPPRTLVLTGASRIRVNAGRAPRETGTAILSPGTGKLVEDIPLRRLGAPEEAAKTIYYLCTEQSSYVTGAELHINGGRHD